MKLNHKIKELRESQKITQQEMADYIGINQNTYHLIEIGSSSLKMEHFIKICEKLKKNPGDLLTTTINNLTNSNSLNNELNQTINVSSIYTDQKVVIKLLANQLDIKDNQITKEIVKLTY